MGLQNINRALLLLGSLLCTFGFAASAEAASLYFVPSAGSSTVGSSFNVDVYVASEDQAMNATQGVISFPNNILQVTSLSLTGSIITFWADAPAYTNTNGTIAFEGVVLNPGYQGPAGKLFTISFKGIDVGTATAFFSSASILANDGKGTNLISGVSSASYAVSVPVSAPPPVDNSVTPVGAPGTPSAVQIVSSTHPNPDAWYANNVATLSWTLPADVTASSVVVDQVPNTVPAPATGLVSTYTTVPLADGVWYAHVRLKNAAGWGSVSNFRLQIDTAKPERFEVQTIASGDPTDPVVRLQFVASDQTSGIDHYDISIDGANPLSWTDDGSHIFQSPALTPGKHVFQITGFDKAGNTSTQYVNVEIEAAATAPFTGPTLMDAGRIAQLFLIATTLLAALLFLVGILLLFIWQRLAAAKRLLQRETVTDEQHARRMTDALEHDATLDKLQKDIRDIEGEFRGEKNEIRRQIRKKKD